MRKAKPVIKKLISFAPDLVERLEEKEPDNDNFTAIVINACKKYVTKNNLSTKTKAYDLPIQLVCLFFI